MYSNPSPLTRGRFQKKNHHQGIVLVLLTLVMVLGSVSVFLSSGTSAIDERQQLKLKQTRQMMKNIVTAIHGFTFVNSRMPCPDVTGDGISDSTAGSCDNSEGNVPWTTLSVDGKDRWGQNFIYRITLGFGNAPATCISIPSSAFFTNCVGNIGLYDNAADSAALTNPIATNISAVILSTGYNRGSQSVQEAENTDSDRNFIRRTSNQNAPNEFNDLLYFMPSK